MTDEQIVNRWKSEISIAECFKSDYCDGIKVDVIKQTVDLINRQKAEIAVLSVENSNSKICVEDLNAELENKNVELVGMRGACESYKMHYDNARAEIENKNVEIDILIRKKKTLRDEISELTAEVERLEAQHREMCIGMKVLKKKAIKEFAEELVDEKFSNYDKTDDILVYDIQGRIYEFAENYINRMAGDAK